MTPAGRSREAKQTSKRLNVLLGTALVVGLALFAGPALATDLTCDVQSGNECQITTLHNLGAGGIFTTPAGFPVLHIIGPAGELRTNAGSTLTLNIEGASPNGLIIELGGKITGNTTGATGVGATININVAAGNVLLAESGATSSAANTAGGGCVNGHGGVINLTANGLNASITTEDGTVISVSGDTCPAGAINIAAPTRAPSTSTAMSSPRAPRAAPALRTAILRWAELNGLVAAPSS